MVDHNLNLATTADIESLKVDVRRLADVVNDHNDRDTAANSDLQMRVTILEKELGLFKRAIWFIVGAVIVGLVEMPIVLFLDKN